MLDETDSRLIAALRRDGRAALSDLALSLGLSRATIRTRMERLAARGEIAGFTVITRAEAGTAPVRGLMMLAIEGRGAERVTARLLGMPSVQAVHSTNGKWDMVVDLATETLAELDAVLAQVRRLEGVAQSETSLLLTTRRPGVR